MDEKLQKQLIRQLRWLNIVVTSFGVLLLLALGMIGFLLFQVITFARDTGEQLQSLRQDTTEQFNVKDKACQDESLGNFLKNNSSVCN